MAQALLKARISTAHVAQAKAGVRHLWLPSSAAASSTAARRCSAAAVVMARAAAASAARGRRRAEGSVVAAATRGEDAAAAARPMATAAAAAAPASIAACSQAQLLLMSERGTAALAKALATDLRAGDAYLLRGAVGAGKSAFSRAFVRAAAGDPDLPVPSPTFLLQQVYDDHEGPPIHHFDLYRLDPSAPGAHARLDLPTSFSRAVSLIEWPERLAAGAGGSASSDGGDGSSGGPPAARLELDIEPLGEGDDPAAAAAAAEAVAAAAAGPPMMASSDGDSVDEEEEGDDDDDPYADRRWRRVSLRAFGAAWQERLAALVARTAGGRLSRHVVVIERACGGGMA